MHKTPLSRYDYQQIVDWVQPNSRVLDLGCGDGRLLKHLQQNKQVSGYGLELNPDMITDCLANDINIIQTNLDDGLTRFDDDSFDYVILSLTLQAMQKPEKLLREMMRVGKQGIVTFPNFGYWRNRWQIAAKGTMPVSKHLPHMWYNTPNIHLCTLTDFHQLCDDFGYRIESTIAVNRHGRQSFGLRCFPNVFGEIALCLFSKNQ